jgi:hypothetical protein
MRSLKVSGAPNPGRNVRGAVAVQGFEMQAWCARVWIRASYPGQGESAFPVLGPHFCFLTYEQLVPGEPAYTDGRGAWVSVGGYEEYIAGDLLRFRTRPATG